jgi:hypothetical protein
MADVVFALSPALVNNEVIDYSTAKGVKLYKSNISKLPVKTTSISRGPGPHPSGDSQQGRVSQLVGHHDDPS